MVWYRTLRFNNIAVVVDILTTISIANLSQNKTSIIIVIIIIIVTIISILMTILKITFIII